MKDRKKLTKQEVIAKINDLLANNNQKITKYQRNYSLYNQCPMTDLRAKKPYVVGYVDDVYSEDSVVPKLNVIKSAIDSVVSKISTAHCRPFVNTVKGSFKTIQLCKQLQTFFDYYYDEKNVPSKIIEALRDACVFDSGFIYFNEVTGEVENISPWNFYSRQVEKNNFKSCYIEFPNQSVDLLSDEDFELLTKTEQKGIYATIGYFYDSNTKTKATLVNRQIRDISEIKFDCVPVVPIYYTLPIIGNTTLSITDMLRGIQIEIDELMQRISDASVSNPAQTFFLSNASAIKVGQLNNKVGNVVQYNSANGGSPVEVSTPNFIADQYNALLDNLMEKAYNMVGISQLSAQGKKPTGLDSGVALATQADIESDRFQVLLDQYIRTYTELAKLMVKMFQQDKDIVEPNRYSLRLKWGDVEKEYDKMRIQFSAADSLSKDPSVKLQQLQTLAQAGIIPATQIASLLELPDIQRGYNAANNAYSATMTLIDGCIYEDKYEIPDYVPYQMLKEQIVNMELSLRSASTDGSNDEDIAKLQKYYEMVEDREMELAEGGMGAGMQDQTNAQDVSQNNMYSAQNNAEFGNGVTDTMNSTVEGTASPYQTEAEVSNQ